MLELRFIFLAFTLCCCGALTAQEPTQLLSRADRDQAAVTAIHDAVAAYVEVFNAHDADAVTEHWDAEAEYVLPSGNRLAGKEAIRESFRALFASGEAPRISVLDANVRLISPDVGIEEGSVKVEYPDGGVEESTYVAVHVLKSERWLMTMVRETAAPAPQPNPSFEHLQELEWLIGQWQDSDGTEIEFRWTAKQKFIQGNFRLALPEGDSQQGTQIIAWDPESQVIRSWVFNSEGGFGEGLWSKQADGTWQVELVQVLPDGTRGSMTNVYSQVHADLLEWRSLDRQIDGVALPEIGPMQISRQLTSVDETGSVKPVGNEPSETEPVSTDTTGSTSEPNSVSDGASPGR